MKILIPIPISRTPSSSTLGNTSDVLIDDISCYKS